MQRTIATVSSVLITGLEAGYCPPFSATTEIPAKMPADIAADNTGSAAGFGLPKFTLKYPPKYASGPVRSCQRSARKFRSFPGTVF